VALSGLVAAACTVAVLDARPALERLASLSSRAHAHAQTTVTAQAAVDPAPSASVELAGVSQTGSTIQSVRYGSAALHSAGSFLVYLPPGFSFGAHRYPALYVLHGNNETAASFLELGLQQTLDRLTAKRVIPPVIAVMIQSGPGAHNWRDKAARAYESYVLEVQKLVDRMFPTLAERGARAIAGYSMGGYGAMNIALGHPDRFGVVESWLGFFNGLEGELRTARATIARSGLQAFVYGGASDTIVGSAEDAPFAAALRAAGANATSAVYAGGHTLETLRAHLAHGLTFAGRALALAPGEVAPIRPAR
jgi:enterochelin esterase-like enzyme